MPTKTTPRRTPQRIASKTAARKNAASQNDDEFKRKADESFEEFHARVWNYVHDAHARAREAAEKDDVAA